MSRNQPTPLLFTLIAPYVLSAMASTPAPSSLPQVDFSRMGSVGLGGSFSGLDWWSSSSPFASSSTSTQSFSSDGDSVFVQGEDGTYKVLGSTNAGGVVNAMCWSNSSVTSSESAFNGTLYIGGTFSSVSSISSSNIIAYSLSSSTFHALSNGLSGTVNTLYCDNPNGEVWVGGSFTAPTGTGGNVALWSTSSSSWTAVDFGGLNGEVESISPSSSGDSLYFGGSFTTSFLSNSSSILNSTSIINGTNGASIPSAPSNTSTVGNSGYLTPVTLPSSSSSSGSLQITAGPSTNQQQYSDPNVLLCPGTGTWLAQDNTVASVDVMGYNYWRATGARVANGLIQGRGATSFCFTSLPDNTQLNMTYTDPVTGKNETCWDHCPLSTESSISAQDYIFTTGPRNLTGLQMQLKTWIGDGAGLSSVQLLSDGAYGSAVQSENQGRCASTGSTAQQTGNWQQKTLSTDIPATTSYYLTATVPVSNPTYPSVTFYPQISSAGYYDVYMLIPGCQQQQDCDGRTTVDVEVFPTINGLGWTSTVSEQVQDDTRTLVYSGWMDGSSGSFSPTISLALASNPQPVAKGNNYIVVADAVQLVLTGVDIGGVISGSTGSGMTSAMNPTTHHNSTRINNSSSQVAFGVFQWSRASTMSVNAASTQLSNTTETAVTQVGFSLGAALNTSGSAEWSVNAITQLDKVVFVAGNFTASGNYSNVISVDTTTNQTTSLANQGLNGVVHAATTIGSYVYFGGEFASTAASGGPDLEFLARYDNKAQSWAAVGGGVDGMVTDLTVSPTSSTQLLVLGNFSHVINADGSTTQTGGYAVYDTSSSTWSTSSVLFGTVTTASADTSGAIYLSGKVSGISSNAANGVAMLSTGDDGSATISTLSGATLSSIGSAPAASTTTGRRRHVQRRNLPPNWLSRFTHAIVERAAPVLSIRATAPTIPTQNVAAPAVLAGAFWTNSSASRKPSVTILGGNFTSGSGSSDIEGVAFYANNKLSGPNPPVQGVVRTLDVIGNTVYIGGTGVNATGIGAGLLVYNLESGSYVTGGMPSLNPASGQALSINVIKHRSNTNTVVLAGNFASAGSLSCAAFCLWDSSNAQWSTPGSGLSSGEVRAIDFAGDTYETVILAGSFVMSNGVAAYAAAYSFTNSSWTALGTLPGPALAIAVDNKNASNIFAAGYTTSDNSAYLQRWDGQSWSAQNSSLLPGSLVSQLAFVPMRTEHDAVGSIENDRMLMVSGDLYLDGTGNATSALYDGAKWYPYLVGTTSAGGLGSASALFWSESTFSFDVRHFLARGLVVLVAIAIATGLILLLILIAFLLAYLFRRRERSSQTHRETFMKEGSEVSSTHQHVFNNVQAALEQNLMAGSTVPTVVAAHRRSEESRYGGAGDSGEEEEEEEDEDARETMMRYDFDGPELQPGEMAMRSGQRVIILDDVQSMEWWYARDPVTGREGVMPATYVW